MSTPHYELEEGENLTVAQDKPAIGLIATEDNADSIVRSVLRAKRNGYTVLVTHHGTSNSKSLEFARELDATILETEEELDPESLVRTLSTAARHLGLPGVVLHTDTERYIDFDRSTSSFRSDTEYVTEAKTITDDRTNRTLVAIPAYNEADSIRSVVLQARKHADTVLVVDDGSTDETADRAREAGAIVLEHERNRGYGASLKTTFREADRRGTDQLVILDGDGQHDPDDIPKLLAHQRQTDAEIVVGSRFVDDTETDLPLYRRAGLRIVNTLMNFSLDTLGSESRIRDTQSGFRVYDERAIRTLAAADGIGDHMDASLDVLYSAHRHDFRIDEVGTTVDYAVEDGSSHSPLAHGLVLVRNIASMATLERPITVLGVPGILTAIAGLAFGSVLFATYRSDEVLQSSLTFFSSLLILVGTLACISSVVLYAARLSECRH